MAGTASGRGRPSISGWFCAAVNNPVLAASIAANDL